MRVTIIAAVGLVLGCGPGWAQPVGAKALIQIHDDLDGMCRGWSGDLPQTNEVCAEREKASQALKTMGLCVSYPAHRWGRC